MVTSDPSLAGYPWARLVVEGNPVEPLELALAADALEALGVQSSRSYTATSPQVWLLVFEFESQARLLQAQPALLAAIGDGPPHYRQTTHTGAWLLVAGFAGHKPVSPQMQAALDEFLAAWAGEE